MAQLTEVPMTDLHELTKDGKVFVTPTYETVARTLDAKEHTVFSASGDGEKNFRLVTFDSVPTKDTLQKAAVAGLVELEFDEPTLIDFNYPENGVTKNQLALRVKNIKIKGEK